MYHFISGLPRAGSTLLASILRQNPACHASIMSPTGRIISDVIDAMGSQNEARSYITDQQRADIVRAVFDAYYADVHNNVIFDNNRRWTNYAGILDSVFPDGQIVCCVRSPAAVVDSFEQLFQQNPIQTSIIYGGASNLTAYDRVTEIMKPTGVVGFALSAFRSAFFGPYAHKLVVVEYDNLARFPAAVMEDLTEKLHLPKHNYRFDRIEPIPGAERFDQDVSTPGLHSLKPQVVYENRKTLLPPDIWASLPPPFWRVKEPETTTR